MNNKINIIDILQEIGLERIKVQDLHSQIDSISTSKNGTVLSLITKEISAMEAYYDQGKQAFIVWIKRDDLAQAQEKLGFECQLLSTTNTRAEAPNGTSTAKL